MQYTKSTLNNVKDLDIVDIISKFLTLKRQGANYLTSCPFHDEKSPSFLISPSKQIYKCFGGCDAGGDGIQFVMEYEKISFVEAIEKIANLFGIPLEYEHFTDEELQFFKKEREEKAILENA